MNAIRILRGCGASGGASLQSGRVYSVPEEVTRADAELLVRLGKAERTEAAVPAKRKTK